jgi:hypothetical protein
MAMKYGKQPIGRKQSQGPLLREVSSKSLTSRRNSHQQLSKQELTGTDQADAPQNAEVLAQDVTSIQREELIDQARNLLSRGLKANLAAGRAYNQLKPFFPHGEWVPFLKNEAASFGLSFRTLQEFMRMARESDALVKKEKSASFGQADDPQAKAITNANETAKATRAQIEEQLSSPVKSQSTRNTNRHRKAGIYRLPLSLTGQQKLYVDALRDLPNWADVELAIITNLEKLFDLYGVVNHPAEPGLHNNRELGTTATVKGHETDINSETAIDAAQV